MVNEETCAAWPDNTCVVCPAQVLDPGEFDVVDRPGPQFQYSKRLGYRVNASSLMPVCVHPFRVGLPPALYATQHTPLPDDSEPTPDPDWPHLELPADVADLEGWFVARLRAVEPDRMASALGIAEAIATSHFPAAQVLPALRRAWACELGRH